jgi:hypothetical protein
VSVHTESEGNMMSVYDERVTVSISLSTDTVRSVAKLIPSIPLLGGALDSR